MGLKHKHLFFEAVENMRGSEQSVKVIGKSENGLACLIVILKLL